MREAHAPQNLQHLGVAGRVAGQAEQARPAKLAPSSTSKRSKDRYVPGRVRTLPHNASQTCACSRLG